MPAIMMKGSVPMEMKKVSISAKRQITIPKKFFTMLGFDTEAECMVRGNELVIRPVKANTGGEFAEQILADLIGQGYSGNELLQHFKQAQSQVRPAVEAVDKIRDDYTVGKAKAGDLSGVYRYASIMEE